MGKLNTKGQSSTYNQGQRDRKGKAILTTNVKAIEQGNLPERLHSQSLKHERDGDQEGSERLVLKQEKERVKANLPS